MPADPMPAADAPYVLKSQAGGIVTLTLNRGDKFNALSEEMLAALQAELNALAKDDSARVVVLAAAGRAFCAGHDLKQMRGGNGQGPSADYYNALFNQCSKLMLTIQQLPQPVIARVQGIATAAGCQLVAMCDLAVAAAEAKFAVSGINVGLFCSTPCGGLVAQRRPQAGDGNAADRRLHRRRNRARPRPGQPRGGGRAARRRSRQAGRRASWPSRRSRWRSASNCSTSSWKWVSAPPTNWPARRWPAT